MPLGIERLNARRRLPNDRIVFIKPLDGPDQAYARDFLERVAAICLPIMKAHHLAVMSLEEHEPNLEFVGRNFNAGEVIQLVLKAPYSGHWLPFRHVQMVMMHELSHCKQMNHSPAFWRVRNQLAAQLRELWAKGYTGDGFWSRGETLLSGQYTTQTLPDAEVQPRALCGGTYRTSRRRKRKRKPDSPSTKPSLSYAERQQRRIAKKFGTHGVALGEDEDSRVKLEDGKKTKAKPRVAGSARGRELRAAAALARFEAKEASEKQESSGSETESEDDAGRMEGTRTGLVDESGHSLIKVCEDEDGNDEDVKREMKELHEFDEAYSGPARPAIEEEDDYALVTAEEATERSNEAPSKSTRAGRRPQNREPGASPPLSVPPRPPSPASSSAAANGTNACAVCSMDNPPTSLTCAACSNVLRLASAPKHWRCQSLACKGGQYVNAGDCGICGVCGARRPAG